MQIQNGMWLYKDGYEIHTSSQVYDYRVYEDHITIFCPFVQVEHRGNTLDGGMITGDIFLTNNGVKFNFYHYDYNKNSKFNLNESILKDGKITEEENLIIYKNGKHGVIINKSNCEIVILNNDNIVNSITPNSLNYVIDPNGISHMMISTKIDVSEKLYGLGERFTEFVKNGQSVVLSNEDGGTASNQTYKNVSYVVSTNKYGIFVDHSDVVEFEVGSELVGKNQFSVVGEQIRFEYILGENIGEVVEKFSKLTGDIPKLPEWSYGLWLSTSFTTNYDEETVLSFIDKMDSYEIPFEVFHFDCFWMREFEWMNFTWNEEVFPDPESMLSKIHERGKKVCLWINPYIGQKSPVYREAVEKGYLIKREDNKPWQWDKWQAGLGIVDFTNPEAKKWYKDKLRILIKMGVDSFKTDFGERIPVPNNFYGTEVVNYFDQSDPLELHNYYTYIYNNAVYEVLEEELGSACLFSRSGTVGSQSLPVHWGGDCLSNYVSMAESLRGGLSLSLGGYAYWSHDIGGFEAGCNPDIYKRWTQFGLLSSHSRYHGNSEYKVPWLYGEEAVAVTKKFSEFKNSLMPYFRDMEMQATKLGRPMLRPLIYNYSDDRTTHLIDTEYMLGDKLIIAPIFNDQGKCEYYLPKGQRYYNLLNGEIKEGGIWYNETFDYFNLPVMLKQNSAIILKNDTTQTNFDCRAGFTVLCFALSEEHKLELVYNDTIHTITVSEDGIKDNAGLDFDLTIIK